MHAPLKLAKFADKALVEPRFAIVGLTMDNFFVDNVVEVANGFAECMLQEKGGHGFLKIVE